MAKPQHNDHVLCRQRAANGENGGGIEHHCSSSSGAMGGASSFERSWPRQCSTAPTRVIDHAGIIRVLKYRFRAP
jgi:hypothetical protein